MKDSNAAHEDTRKNKDEIIRQLEATLAREREAWRIETDELKLTIHRLEISLQEAKSKIISLEEIIYKKQDVEAQLAEALKREEANRLARDQLRKELESATDYILELEEKVYKANKTSLELLK